MSSFQSLGNVHQATIAMVAPGISEALVATAIGLFAAIPAVIGYNRLTQAINCLAESYTLFGYEIINISIKLLIRRKQFMIRRGIKRGNLQAQINVVPYIDVMLVLLIIFMITAPMLTQGIDVNLPSSHAKALPVKPSPPIILTITKSGAYYLGYDGLAGQAIDRSQIINRVAALLSIANKEKKSPAIYVQADRDIAYGQVVGGMSLLQAAGAEHVGLMTRPGDFQAKH